MFMDDVDFYRIFGAGYNEMQSTWIVWPNKGVDVNGLVHVGIQCGSKQDIVDSIEVQRDAYCIGFQDIVYVCDVLVSDYTLHLIHN